ncbi:MAG: hypothetical protein IJ058_07310 [Lachnospiraceae bacterium]|nr:hypothetical protein [Lachnospiraceae bacterium]
MSQLDNSYDNSYDDSFYDNKQRDSYASNNSYNDNEINTNSNQLRESLDRKNLIERNNKKAPRVVEDEHGIIKLDDEEQEEELDENINIKKSSKKSSQKSKSARKQTAAEKYKATRKPFNPKLNEALRRTVSFHITREDEFEEQNDAIYRSKTFDASMKRLRKWESRTESESERLSYLDRVKLQKNALNVQLSRVNRDKKHRFFGLGEMEDNKEMQIVKQRSRTLQNVLRCNRDQMEEMGFLDKETGRFDPDKFTSVIDQLFEATIAACDNYLDTHKGSRWFYGSRRKKKINELKDRLLKEQEKYKKTYFAIATGAFLNDRADNIQSPQDLIEHLNVVTIKDPDYQRQGNSTDVYLVTVTGVDGKQETKRYYMKENLPLLHKDMDGFLKRRSNQLSKSWENRQNVEALKKKAAGKKKKTREDAVKTLNTLKSHQREELRMESAHADETDYQNGQELLKLMQDKIDGAGLEEANVLRQKYAEFFKHDFDELFKKLPKINEEIAKRNVGYMPIGLDEWEEKTDDVSVEITKILKTNKLDPMKIREIPLYTPATFLISELNLTPAADSELIDFINKVAGQKVNTQMKTEVIDDTAADAENLIQDGDKKKAAKTRFVQTSRLEALFRITMGKEVELYGQVMKNKNKEEAEMAQYNTLATSLLAQDYGFSEEVVNTHVSTAEFERWDGTRANDVVTLQEIAEGEEWIEVCKKAKRMGKSVRLSPEATRKLVRLQMFDTLCQQQDRHGRNFKCKTKKDKDGNLVVYDIKSYDHDQSFASGGLGDNFKEARDEDGKLVRAEKNRFLPTTLKVIKKTDPEFRYIANKYFNINVPAPKDLMKEIKEPKYDIKLSSHLKSYLPILGFGMKKVEITEKVMHDGEWIRTKHDCRANPFGIHWGDEAKNGNAIIASDFKNDKNSWIKKRDSDKERVSKGEFDRILRNVAKCAVILEDLFIGDKYAPGETTVQEVTSIRKKKNAPKEFSPKNYEAKKFVMGKCLRTQAEMKQWKKDHPDQFKEVARAFKELAELNSKYDFSELTVNVEEAERVCFSHLSDKEQEYFKGFNPPKDDYDAAYRMGQDRKKLFPAWINETLWSFKQAFPDDADVKEAMVDKVDYKPSMKEFMNKNGDLEIPGLLHADKAAYDNILKIIKDYEDGILKNKLDGKKLPVDAQEGMYKRAVEMRDRYKYMQERAEKFLKIKYWNKPENDPHRRFFLNPEDYSKLTDVSDYAIDPGDSYLVQDNEQYLSAQPDFQEFMTAEEKNTRLEARQAVMSDSKRWKDVAPSKLETVVSGSIYDEDEEDELEEFRWSSEEDYVQEAKKKGLLTDGLILKDNKGNLIQEDNIIQEEIRQNGEVLLNYKNKDDKEEKLLIDTINKKGKKSSTKSTSKSKTAKSKTTEKDKSKNAKSRNSRKVISKTITNDDDD